MRGRTGAGKPDSTERRMCQVTSIPKLGHLFPWFLACLLPTAVIGGQGSWPRRQDGERKEAAQEGEK